MSVVFDGYDLLEMIRRGDFDRELSTLNQALFDRQKAMGKEIFRNIKVGEQLRFNREAGDLAFEHVTVVEKHRTNVTVETADGSLYTGNPALLERIPF